MRTRLPFVFRSAALAFALAALLGCGVAAAHCSRPIVVPVSTLGKTVTVDTKTGSVSGVYPELLRAYGKEAGCSFVFDPVPWARAEIMVRTGEGDLLASSMKVPEREAWGKFVPLVGSEWMLISLRSDAPPRTVAELLARRGARVNVVRSFKYGAVYQHMLDTLDRQGRLEYVTDPATVVRKLAAGRADYTFLPSFTFASVMKVAGLPPEVAARARYTRLEDMPKGVSGVYLSPALSPRDAAELTLMFEKIRVNNEVGKHLREGLNAAEASSIYPLQ